jgi:hypothetical protein
MMIEGAAALRAIDPAPGTLPAAYWLVYPTEIGETSKQARPVSFGGQTTIQDRDAATVLFSADQAADPLHKYQSCLR